MHYTQQKFNIIGLQSLVGTVRSATIAHHTVQIFQGTFAFMVVVLKFIMAEIEKELYMILR